MTWILNIPVSCVTVINSVSFVSFVTDQLKLKVSPKDTKAIKLIKGDVDVPAKGGQQFAGADEWYSLVVDPSKELITITGKGPAGVFYGVQTLLALRNSEGRVPKVTIKDAPRYSYRGMHLDVARNFKAKEHVFKLLDAMAMYKLNKFHFHLTDDEGWRLEIPGLPELTEVKLFRLCFQPLPVKKPKSNNKRTDSLELKIIKLLLYSRFVTDPYTSQIELMNLLKCLRDLQEFSLLSKFEGRTVPTLCDLELVSFCLKHYGFKNVHCKEIRNC